MPRKNNTEPDNSTRIKAVDLAHELGIDANRLRTIVKHVGAKMSIALLKTNGTPHRGGATRTYAMLNDVDAEKVREYFRTHPPRPVKTPAQATAEALLDRARRAVKDGLPEAPAGLKARFGLTWCAANALAEMLSVNK